MALVIRVFFLLLLLCFPPSGYSDVLPSVPWQSAPQQPPKASAQEDLVKQQPKSQSETPLKEPRTTATTDSETNGKVSEIFEKSICDRAESWFDSRKAIINFFMMLFTFAAAAGAICAAFATWRAVGTTRDGINLARKGQMEVERAYLLMKIPRLWRVPKLVAQLICACRCGY